MLVASENIGEALFDPLRIIDRIGLNPWRIDPIARNWFVPSPQVLGQSC
jgi:hypothetical protein